MQSTSKYLLLFFFAGIMVINFSCSSSKSYADRKKSKYKKSSRIVKTKQSRNRVKTYTPKGNSTRTSIVQTAKSYLGRKYVYGGKSPKGFDCSGFTSFVFQANGIDLSGPSKNQSRHGVKIHKSKLKEGDLIFFGKGRVSHVGIVAHTKGNSLTVIHSTSSRGVVMEDISDSSYWQSRYLFGRDVISNNYATN